MMLERFAAELGAILSEKHSAEVAVTIQADPGQDETRTATKEGFTNGIDYQI